MTRLCLAARGPLIALITSCLTSTAAAQSLAGIPEVDSASVARQAWAHASRALQNGHIVAARDDLWIAQRAWPTQPAYSWTLAELSARLADTSSLNAALEQYTSLGLGRDWHGHSTLTRYALRRSFASVFGRLYENAQPRGALRIVATLPDSTFWPEGVDYDPVTGSYFLASVRHRTVAELRRDGSLRYLWYPDQRDLGAILGVRVDRKRHVLWATTSGIPQAEGYLPADSTIAALLEIHIDDGAIVRRWSLPPVPGGHVLGDLAVGPDGDVFLTDSNQPVLYRLRSGGDTLEHFTHPLFRSLQGLAPSPSGRDLYVADYSHGLLRIELSSHSVRRVADAPRSTSLGCDGLVWDRGAIVCVQNGVTPPRVVRMVLDASGDRIARVDVLAQDAARAPEPTIGTISGREFVYVANSLWDEFDESGRLRPGARLTRARVVGVKLF